MKNRSSLSILIIYTGGTIGMKENPHTGALSPFNFDNIEEEVPELQKFGFNLQTISFDPPIDSSDITPDFWVKLAELISSNYEKYDGFVILHGTDTMSFTASALSFMLEGLAKPVVLTGSQLPIGMLRTDGKETSSALLKLLQLSVTGCLLYRKLPFFLRITCTGAIEPPSTTPSTSTPSVPITTPCSPRRALPSNTTILSYTIPGQILRLWCTPAWTAP